MCLQTGDLPSLSLGIAVGQWEGNSTTCGWRAPLGLKIQG